MAQCVARDLAQGTRQLHARRAAADHHERHPGAPGVWVGLALGTLEGEQDAPTDAERVVDGLESGRQRLPVIVTEPAVSRAGRDDEAVVWHGRAVGQLDRVCVGIESDGFAQQYLGVRLTPEQRPQGLGDLAGRQLGGGHLVQQRTEEVVVLAVDEGHIDRSAPECPGGVQTAEATADDDHLVSCGSRRLHFQARSRRSRAVTAARYQPIGRAGRAKPGCEVNLATGACDPRCVSGAPNRRRSPRQRAVERA